MGLGTLSSFGGGSAGSAANNAAENDRLKERATNRVNIIPPFDGRTSGSLVTFRKSFYPAARIWAGAGREYPWPQRARVGPAHPGIRKRRQRFFPPPFLGVRYQELRTPSGTSNRGYPPTDIAP